MLGTNALVKNTAATRNLTGEVLEAINTIKEMAETLQHLERIQEDLDSLHSIIGGRLCRKDAVDENTDGPTIQELLQLIDGHLEHLKPPPLLKLK